MEHKSRYTLQRTMIIYILLIGFASVLVGIEFLADFNSCALKSEILNSYKMGDQARVDSKELLMAIDRLQSKAILMVAIIMAVVLIVLTMFIKNITEPLQHMIGMSQQISSGDLSQTIQIDANNELADLGQVINEMATNLQEIIMLTEHLCANGQTHIEEALHQMKQLSIKHHDIDKLGQSINALGDELSGLSEFIAYFNFYTFDQKRNVR